MSEQALKSSTGALFVQRGGANKPLEWLGCATLEDVSESAGGVELVQCFDPSSTPNRPKWKTVGKKFSPPDPVSTTVETLLFPGAGAMEKIRGPFALYALSRISGRAESFANYVRGTILIDASVTERTTSNIVHRNEDEEGMKSYDVEAPPPSLTIFDVSMTRQSTAETENALTCHFIEEDLEALEVGLTGVIGAAGGVAAPNVLQTTDGGDNWAAMAAQPFAIGESVMSTTQVEIDANTFRKIVVRDADAAAPLEIGYSDDDGVTWTNVTVGSTNNEAAAGPRALFALDRFHIWLVTDIGYVYFSDDAGQTWTTQDAGVATAQPLNAVHFWNQLNGVAVADADEIIITTDGGANWGAAAAVTGGGNNLDGVWTMEDRIWIVDDGAQLWYSEDAGASWTERTGWSGSGSGTLVDIAFFTDYVGFMVHNTVAPVGTVLQTINGGFTWEAIDTPSNSGLTSVFALDENTAYVTGNVNAATAFIGKVSA